MTIEQKAWQLWENGVSLAEVHSTAISHDCSADFAIELLWDTKLGLNSLKHCCQPKIHKSGIEVGCCYGK